MSDEHEYITVRRTDVRQAILDAWFDRHTHQGISDSYHKNNSLAADKASELMAWLTERSRPQEPVTTHLTEEEIAKDNQLPWRHWPFLRIRQWIGHNGAGSGDRVSLAITRDRANDLIAHAMRTMRDSLLYEWGKDREMLEALYQEDETAGAPTEDVAEEETNPDDRNAWYVNVADTWIAEYLKHARGDNEKAMALYRTAILHAEMAQMKLLERIADALEANP